MPPSVSWTSSSSSSKPTARRARAIEARPVDVEAGAVEILFLDPGMEGVLAPGGEDVRFEGLETRLAEGPPREPGRILHVPHPIVIVEVLARDLLVRAEMAVLAPARHGARAARAMDLDHGVEIGQAGSRQRCQASRTSGTWFTFRPRRRWISRSRLRYSRSMRGSRRLPTPPCARY